MEQFHFQIIEERSYKKALEVEASNYVLLENQLYKRGKDNTLRLYINETESPGHFFGDPTTKTIMWSELWWPTLFSDANEFIKRYDVCQRTKPPIVSDNMPSRPIMAARAFAKCGIDFVKTH